MCNLGWGPASNPGLNKWGRTCVDQRTTQFHPSSLAFFPRRILCQSTSYIEEQKSCRGAQKLCGEWGKQLSGGGGRGKPFTWLPGRLRPAAAGLLRLARRLIGCIVGWLHGRHLPAGTGKSVRVVVVCKDKEVVEANTAGAVSPWSDLIIDDCQAASTMLQRN